MAKKKFNPLGTVLTIAAVGVTGWAVYNFIIKPRRQKKLAALQTVDSIPGEVLDAQFELIDEQTA